MAKIDFLPETNIRGSMKISELLDLLQTSSYQSEQHVNNCEWLYMKIVKEELMSSRNNNLWRPNEQFFKCGRSKFVPHFYIAQQPGTILR